MVDTPGQNGGQPEAPAIMASMTITLDVNGAISVNGPIDNKMLCYGLLDVARDTIRDHCARKHDEKRVQLAPAGIAPMLRSVK